MTVLASASIASRQIEQLHADLASKVFGLLGLLCCVNIQSNMNPKCLPKFQSLALPEHG